MKDEKDYTYRSIRDERRYGVTWYSALWTVLRPVMVGAAVLVLVTGICMTVWNKLYGEFAAPADTADASEVAFEITSGQSLNRVAANLEEAGLIRNKTIFKYYCDFAGMGQKIQVGSYMLRKNMTINEIAEQLTAGDGNPMVRNITLIPGETVEEFAAKLVKNGALEKADTFLELCRTGEAFKDYYYIADVLGSGNAASRKYVLEGYLAPNTYEVYTSATEEEIIRKLLSQTEAVFPEEYQEQAETLGMSMDQIGKAPILLSVTDDTASSNCGRKTYTIQTDDIMAVELLEKLPDNLQRRAGTGMDTYLEGSFYSPSTDYVTVMLDPTVSPYILITTDSKTYLFGSRDPEKTEMMYNLLKK